MAVAFCSLSRAKQRHGRGYPLIFNLQRLDAPSVPLTGAKIVQGPTNTLLLQKVYQCAQRGWGLAAAWMKEADAVEGWAPVLEHSLQSPRAKVICHILFHMQANALSAPDKRERKVDGIADQPALDALPQLAPVFFELPRADAAAT